VARLKAYYLTEAIKGEALYIVYGTSAKDARERFNDGDRGEGVDNQIHPAGIREIRRAPEEDPDA
jgi:hypothetical protein